MNSEDPDIGQPPGPWTEIVRRAQLSRTVHSVAMTMASYANYKTGREIFPGIARLSVDCKLGYKIVKAAMATLRDVGLIELVRPSPHPGLSDEYRLIFHPDMIDRLTILSPTEHKAAIEAVRVANRGKWKPKSDAILRGAEDPAGSDGTEQGSRADENPDDNLRGSGSPAGVDSNDAPDSEEPAGYGVTAGFEPAGRRESDLRGTARPATNQAPIPSESTSQTSGDLRTDLTVVGAPAIDASFRSDGVDPQPKNAARRCRYARCDGKTWQPGMDRSWRINCPDCNPRPKAETAA